MLFDYERFKQEVRAIKELYPFRWPYPYAYFDGLFDDGILDQVNREIDEGQFEKDIRTIDGVEVKTRSDFDDNESLPPVMHSVFGVMNGGRFLSIVSDLTSISGLISDPYYDGGGVNVIERQGTLAVHVDGTTQHRMQVCRRINAILFLNNYWSPKWNGFHEQWIFTNPELSPFDENQSWKCVRKILPRKNRLYLFTTNDHSWHGHAGILDVPEGVQRRSLITYFYTSTRPDTDLVFENPHSALFIKNDKTLREGAYDETEIIL